MIPPKIGYIPGSLDYDPISNSYLGFKVPNIEVRWIVGKLYLERKADLRVPYRHFLYMGPNGEQVRVERNVQFKIRKLTNGHFGNAFFEAEALNEQGKLTLIEIAKVLGIQLHKNQ